MNREPNIEVPEFAKGALAKLTPDAAQHLAALINASSDPTGAWQRMTPIIAADPGIAGSPADRTKLLSIVTSSRALARTLALHPGLLRTAPPGSSITLQVRSALASIAGDDLSGVIDMADATARFSDAIDEIVGNQLVAARRAIEPSHPVVGDLPFAVIAMGKWGARELNYASDVDLLFVHDAGGLDPSAARLAALGLASRLMGDLSAATFDGPALLVDADLRPEGTMGPLSRSIEGYERYYREWAEAWELQALLKARAAAGDADLGRRFIGLATRVIWEQGLDAEALRSIRKIKEQVELTASSFDIKRARGGIRDIEFTTQVLQLVHGRLDSDLRSPRTLDALAALSEHGFIEAEDKDVLSRSYRFLRNLEHRIQLWDLRQSHTLPADTEDRARIGRSLGLKGDPAEALTEELARVRSSVRDIHERLYFRPILDALVGSPSARIGIEQAALRLEALGFADVTAATRALEEMTSGVTRRSRVMNQVLPLMLDWLSLSPDPDMGLKQLRMLLSRGSDHSHLIVLLQNNPLAGERLCHLLGTGRLMGELIDRIPEFVPRLADDALLDDIRGAKAAADRLTQLLDSRPDPEAKLGTIRRFARRRKLRIAARDVLTDAPVSATIEALSNSADAVMSGALKIIDSDGTADFAVVAMGKWGGRELSYESDLDVMYAFSHDDNRDKALKLSSELSRVLSEPSKHGEAYLLDSAIRPEGKSGPLARSLDSYRRYYQEWAEPWELLALIRARPIAGNKATCEGFMEGIEPIVWRPEVPLETVRAIRSIKARVEAERIPPGEDPDYHLKLGKGGLSDVEFLVQMLQLQNGGRQPALRVTGTLDALRRLYESEYLTSDEFRILEEAYLFCTQLRLRLHLQTGRVTDSLPTERRSLARAAASLGYDRASDLREHYRRVTRRARQVFERRFY